MPQAGTMRDHIKSHKTDNLQMATASIVIPSTCLHPSLKGKERKRERKRDA